MTLVSEKIYTVEEYFELERKSDVRHEFVHGQLIPMSGESKDANRIALNIFAVWNPILYPQGFDIFLHDVKTRVYESGIYRYPDLVVAPIADDEDTHVVTQPVVIVEVISDGTAGVDRGEKLREYCNIPTLQYYLIIEQDQTLIEMYTRQDDQWIVEFFDASNDHIQLEKLGVDLSLETIYHRIKF